METLNNKINSLPIRIFFLVSQSLTCNVTSADILAGLKTDHSFIIIEFAPHHLTIRCNNNEINTYLSGILQGFFQDEREEEKTKASNLRRETLGLDRK